jgi:hypothetical protein
MISLLGAEWEHIGSAQTEEERVLDYSNFSIAQCIKKCNEDISWQPDLKSKLMMKNLPTLLRFIKYEAWWMPGVPDFNDEEDELGGMYIIYRSMYGISLILADNDQPAAEQVPSALQPVLKDGDGAPMDQDEYGDKETPCLSRMCKHAMITSPSELDVHPARHPRIFAMKVSTFFC